MRGQGTMLLFVAVARRSGEGEQRWICGMCSKDRGGPVVRLAYVQAPQGWPGPQAVHQQQQPEAAHEGPHPRGPAGVPPLQQEVCAPQGRRQVRGEVPGERAKEPHHPHRCHWWPWSWPHTCTCWDASTADGSCLIGPRCLNNGGCKRERVVKSSVTISGSSMTLHAEYIFIQIKNPSACLLIVLSKSGS